MNSKKRYIYLFLIFLFLRIWNIDFGLPYDGIHPTENFTISQSLQYLNTGNLKPADFQHPTLYQYLISLIARVIFLPTKSYPYFYLLGRFISCLASLFSVYLLYRLARELLNSKTLGLLCACFLGFNLLSIKYAHYAVPDSLCLLFIVLSLSFSLKILKKPILKNYLICALFCGLSLGSKFSGLISLGFLLCTRLNKKFFLGLLMVFLIFLLVSPYHLFYLKEAIGDFSKYTGEKGYFLSAAFKAKGLFTYPFILLPDIFGFLGILFSLAGLGIMLSKDRRRGLVLLIPSILYLLLIGNEKGGTLQNVLPLLPILSIFTVYFFFWLKEKGLNRNIIAMLVILTLLPNFTKAIMFDYFISKKDTRVLAQEWLLKNVKEKSKIAFERYAPFDINYLGKSQVKEKFNSTYFMPSLSFYPAPFYKNEGFDYIITSNFRQDSYKFFCQAEGQCQPVDNYSTYDTQLALAAVFEPSWVFKLTAVSLPWGTWPHQPVVKIYKIPDK